MAAISAAMLVAFIGGAQAQMPAQCQAAAPCFNATSCPEPWSGGCDFCSQAAQCRPYYNSTVAAQCAQAAPCFNATSCPEPWSGGCAFCSQAEHCRLYHNSTSSPPSSTPSSSTPQQSAVPAQCQAAAACFGPACPEPWTGACAQCAQAESCRPFFAAPAATPTTPVTNIKCGVNVTNYTELVAALAGSEAVVCVTENVAFPAEVALRRPVHLSGRCSGKCVLTASGANRLFTVNGTAGGTVTFEGLALTNGSAVGSNAPGPNGLPTFETFYRQSGGALLMPQENALDVIVKGCRFQGNRAAVAGGAMSIMTVMSFAGMKNNAWLRIEDTEFKDNAAWKGGAVYAFGQSGRADYYLHVKDSVFEDNSASDQGGGIFITPNPGDLHPVLLAAGNVAEFQKMALDARSPAGSTFNAMIDKCTFKSNKAVVSGGAVGSGVMYYVRVKDSSFKDNKVTAGKGGTLFTKGAGRMVITNVSITGGIATDGGAVFASEGNVTFYGEDNSFRGARGGARLRGGGRAVLLFFCFHPFFLNMMFFE